MCAPSRKFRHIFMYLLTTGFASAEGLLEHDHSFFDGRGGNTALSRGVRNSANSSPSPYKNIKKINIPRLGGQGVSPKKRKERKRFTFPIRILRTGKENAGGGGKKGVRTCVYSAIV